NASGVVLAGNVNASSLITLNVTAGNVSQTSGVLTAASLLLTGAGSFLLTQAGNDINTIAADLNAGSIDLVDVDDVTIGSVSGTSGIATGNPASGGNVTISAGTTITVNQPIDTTAGSGGTLSLAGSVTLNAALTVGQGNITLSAAGGTGDLIIDA